MPVSLGSSWVDLSLHVHSHSLEDLVADHDFVQILMDKTGFMNDNSYISFVELATDTVHDYFGLSAEQRRVVRSHI